MPEKINDWKQIFETDKKGEETAKSYFKRIAEKYGTTYTYARKRYYQYHKTLDVGRQVQKDREAAKRKVEEIDIKRKYNHLLKQLEESETRYQRAVEISAPIDTYKIEPLAPSTAHEAVPIIGLSDWHFEERVDPDTINGLNEYNPDIATSRWNKCIQNSLKLVHKERQSSEIRQMVLWLGGDFINGYIHLENIEENFLSPTQATMFAKERIVSAIDFYLKHGKFEKITVVCNYGNHGRTTEKMRIGSGYKNSYEWMMYKFLEKHYQGNDAIQFVIPNGFMAYVDILGYTWRFMHGDSVKYNGGIGGLTVPLIKYINRCDQQKPAHYTMIGHYHNLFQATRNCMVNGSGIGFNAYAQRIGASPEDPQQAFCLVDKKYGLTIKTPIFCR